MEMVRFVSQADAYSGATSSHMFERIEKNGSDEIRLASWQHLYN